MNERRYSYYERIYKVGTNITHVNSPKSIALFWGYVTFGAIIIKYY